jgi:antitoxin (DNA-binding transcriptional repressor) of toxin-antitoxin stability system
VEAGDEVLITRRGQAVARLIAAHHHQGVRGVPPGAPRSGWTRSMSSPCDQAMPSIWPWPGAAFGRPHPPWQSHAWGALA